MSGKKNRKKEIVQIDADWLLGESNVPSERDFSWFRRIFVCLICILVAVWSWPYASKQWLRWEWQQQLSNVAGKQSEDVLPILLALNELGPIGNEEIVEQLASPEPSKRTFAFQLLEQRITQWKQASRPGTSEINSLIDALGSKRVRSSESLLLRGQLAMQLQPLLNDLPEASKLQASVDAMIIQGERSGMPAAAPSATIIPKMKPTVVATRIRMNDSAIQAGSASEVVATHSSTNEYAPVAPSPFDTASLSHLQNRPHTLQGKSTESGPVLTSMRTLTDQATSASVAHLPNLNLSIPRTVPRAAIVPTPSFSAEPADANASGIENVAFNSQPPTVIKGIEKRNLEGLLPLLTSAQSRIVEQALFELERRGMTTPQLEIAMALAQGDVEQRLKAMETIAKDPKFDAIPWLAWMAGGADRTVRRRAVVLLGSMTDPDAMRKLRILQSREPDSAIADQINQVLLAAGTASISFR